jgi:hypothetical protein
MDNFVFWPNRFDTSGCMVRFELQCSVLACVLVCLSACSPKAASPLDVRGANRPIRPAGALLLYRDRADATSKGRPLVPDSKIAYDLAALLFEDSRRSAWPRIAISVRNQRVTLHGAKALDAGSRSGIEAIVTSVSGVRSLHFSSLPPPVADFGYATEFVD